MDLFEELRELLGDDACIKLLGRYAGRRLYIPLEMRENHHLYWWLGDDAKKLSEMYGGTTIELPLAPTRLWELRRKRIIELRKSGASIQQIIQTLGCSRRGIQRVLASAPPAKRPAERQMFGGENG